MDSESATLRRAAKQPQIIFSPVMCQNSSHLENPLLSASGGAQNSTALNSRGELQLTPPHPLRFSCRQINGFCLPPRNLSSPRLSKGVSCLKGEAIR